MKEISARLWKCAFQVHVVTAAKWWCGQAVRVENIPGHLTPFGHVLLRMDRAACAIRWLAPMRQGSPALRAGGTSAGSGSPCPGSGVRAGLRLLLDARKSVLRQ